MMAVLKPSQLQLIRNMSVKLMREPRDSDDLDASTSSASDLEENNSALEQNSALEVVGERHVELAYRKKEPID